MTEHQTAAPGRQEEARLRAEHVRGLAAAARADADTARAWLVSPAAATADPADHVATAEDAAAMDLAADQFSRLGEYYDAVAGGSEPALVEYYTDEDGL